MLKILWVIDAVLLFGTIAISMLSRNIDSAGRGILLAVPLVVALGLGASFWANRSGAVPLAIGIALIGPAIVGGVFLSVGRSVLASRAELSGANYWTAPAQKELIRAIMASDTVAMRAATQAGADVNLVGKTDITVLEFTIANKPEMVAEVVKLGADPNRKAENRLSPLAQALDSRSGAFEMLLDAGADPNGPGDNQSSILFDAIRSQSKMRVQALLDRGADPKLLDVVGATTIMAAGEHGEWAMALDFLNRGVDPSVVSQRGDSIESIIERSRANYKDNADFDALVAALKKRQPAR